MCVEPKATVFVWICKVLGLWKLVRRVLFQNIRSGDSPYYAVGDALWQSERTRSRSYFLKFAQAEWTRIYRDIASSEQPCSPGPASSHGRLRFRPVIVTTVNAQSSLSAPFSVGMKLLFAPWTVLVLGDNLCTPGIILCKTTKTSDICSD